MLDNPKDEDPKEGDLCVWWIPQVPMKAFTFPATTVVEGWRMLRLLADYDMFQWTHKVKPDYCNAGGLVVFHDGDWEDWECPESGDSLDEYANAQGWKHDPIIGQFIPFTPDALILI